MKITVAAVLATAVFLGGAPPAQADPGIDHYLAELEKRGIAPATENEKLKASVVGLVVCVDLFNGFTTESEMKDLIEIGFTPSQAVAVFEAATNNLCAKAVDGAR